MTIPSYCLSKEPLPILKNIFSNVSQQKLYGFSIYIQHLHDPSQINFYEWCEVGAEVPFYPCEYLSYFSTIKKKKKTFPFPIGSLWCLLKSDNRIRFSLFLGSLSCLTDLYVDPCAGAALSRLLQPVQQVLKSL